MTSPKTIVIEKCGECPFHRAIWTENEHKIARTPEGKWKDGEPACICMNGMAVPRDGFYKGTDRPILCRTFHGSCKVTFKGKFPSWCPLAEVNKCHAGWFGKMTAVPDDEWFRGAPL
ncbi:MAG: hypothetical protein WC375_09970 [Methanomassiliicoccales archaeon]